MDSTELRAMQAPIKERYKAEPEAASITLKARGTLDDTNIACKVETGRAIQMAGLHPKTGGSGMGYQGGQRQGERRADAADRAARDCRSGRTGDVESPDLAHTRLRVRGAASVQLRIHEPTGSGGVVLRRDRPGGSRRGRQSEPVRAVGRAALRAISSTHQVHYVASGMLQKISYINSIPYLYNLPQGYPKDF